MQGNAQHLNTFITSMPLLSELQEPVNLVAYASCFICMSEFDKVNYIWELFL